MLIDIKEKYTTVATKGIEIKNKGLFIIGIIFLAIGLVASFYHATQTYYGLHGEPIQVNRGYPYQTVGIILTVAGIVLLALGFLYSSASTVSLLSKAATRKQETP
jgi:uncharacterized membrane protein